MLKENRGVICSCIEGGEEEKEREKLEQNMIGRNKKGKK